MKSVVNIADDIKQSKNIKEQESDDYMTQRKKLSRKVISYALALVMMFSTFFGIVPGASLTAQAEGTTYNLWLGETEVTGENLSGDGWTYAPDTNTLTLNNYSYSGEGHLYDDNITRGCILYGGSDALNIVLEGKNSIINTSSETSNFRRGIYSTQKLTISGEGSLEVSAPGIYNSCGLDVNGELIINSGNINATGNAGIRASDNITISGGSVTASGEYGITWNNSEEQNMTIGSGITYVDITGTASASDFKIKNEIVGTGWTDTEGTQGKVNIAVNRTGSIII